MSQIHSALQVLRSRGYRVTEPRKRVLRVLAEVQRPVSPYDIQEILQRKGQYLNHVTIYRVLDGCHRFVVCRQCGNLREYADKTLCEEEKAIAQEFGFRAEQHFSEFSGICSECVASAKS